MSAAINNSSDMVKYLVALFLLIYFVSIFVFELFVGGDSGVCMSVATMSFRANTPNSFPSR